MKRLEVVAQIFANALARKRADQALRESEARLNLAADSAEAGLWVLDCGKQVFWATEKCRALFGYSPEEVISMERFKASVHPEDWDLVQGSLERAVQTGEPVNVEYRIDAGEGRARWITSRGRPQFTPAGKADRVLGVSIDITERKRAEEAFRASEARLAAGSEMAGLGYYEADYGACSCFLDDRIRAISGVPAELKEGLDPVQFWSEHIHPEDRQLVQDERQKLHHGNVDWISVEYRYLHPALGQRWLHHSTRTAERRAGGAGMRVFGVVRDITQYKQLAEEQAEDSRFGNLIADLSSKFVNLPAAEVDNAIEEAQRRVCEFLGLGLSSLWQPVIETSGEYRLTHDYRSAGGPPIKHMSAKDNFPWCLRRLLAGEVIAVSSMDELPPEAARDQEVWRHLGIKTSLTVPMSTGGASAIGFLSFNDLTRERDWPVKLVNRLQLVAQIFANALARKVADQQLRESEEVNRATFEQAGVGIAHVGTDGHWLRVNDKLCAILGFPREELMQMTFQSITHPDDLETDLELMRQTLSGGISTYSLAKRYFRKDKSMVWANLTVSLVRNEAGGPKHFISVVEDITERKQAEASVLQQRAELAHLSRVAMLGELSGAMAHELNQPLTAILSNAQAAQRFLAGDETDLGEVRDILADIVTEDKRAGEIIRRLRLLLKKGEVQHQPLSVNEVVSGSPQARAQRPGESKRRHRRPNSPRTCRWFEGDRVQLQQVVLNLVMNACEAMAGTEKNARQLTIRTDRSEDGSVCVSVADCGPGIAPEKLEQIFRILLHHQGARHGPGPDGVPHHHHGAQREAVGSQ